jgi:hypothetical protein
VKKAAKFIDDDDEDPGEENASEDASGEDEIQVNGTNYIE